MVQIMVHPFFIRILASRNRQRKVKTRESPAETPVLRKIFRWEGNRFCLSKKIFASSSKGKLIKPFEENVELRQDCLEAQSELDRREWKVQSAVRALHESGIQLHSQRMELHQANQLTDQSQKRKELVVHRFGTERPRS